MAISVRAMPLILWTARINGFGYAGLLSTETGILFILKVRSTANRFVLNLSGLLLSGLNDSAIALLALRCELTIWNGCGSTGLVRVRVVVAVAMLVFYIR